MSYNWVASLSNGQRLSMRDIITEEGVGKWDQVVNYTKKNNVTITHIEVTVNGRRYNSPSNSKNASFKSGINPEKFWIYYRQVADLDPVQSEEHYIAYSYRIGECRHFYWVNTNNNFCYAQVLNVVNPTNQEEKNFAGNECFINNMYDG